MATAWITYSWKDNEQGDVDYIVQELVRAGLKIKLDRWNLQAGRRLWEQIDKFIRDPNECDGWIFYATQNSLASEACREELAYALERALSSRGGAFPIIALVQSHMEGGLLPAAIKTRLYVDLTDPEWKERIVDAVTNRTSARAAAELTPSVSIEHPAPMGFAAAIEVRPRAGVWHPFAACVKPEERHAAGLVLRDGPRGFPPDPNNSGFIGGGTGMSDDQQWYVERGYNAATQTHSYYLFFRKVPSIFAYGQLGTPGQMYFFVPKGSPLMPNLLKQMGDN
jgi:hypothetical protein